MSNGVCEVSRLEPAVRTLPMSRLTSHKTRPGSRSVIFQSHARRPRCKRRMSAQCSSNSHQAIRALLRMQHPRQHRHSKSVPMTGCIQRSYSNTSLVQCQDHVAQQLLLFTIVAAVVTCVLCFITVSLSLSLFFVRVCCFPAGSFHVKAGPRRRLVHSLCPKQPSRLHGTPPTWRHTRARASSPYSQQSRVGLVMSQAYDMNILLSPRCV